MTLFQQWVIKAGALFSYCGGPLIVCDLLKPRLGGFLAFGVPFAPILLMVLGAESLLPRRQRVAPGPPGRDESGSDHGAELRIRLVRLGLIGALLTLMMHVWGAWFLATTAPRPNQNLYVFGIVVGIPLAGVYAYSARRWLNRVRGPQDSLAPVEPR